MMVMGCSDFSSPSSLTLSSLARLHMIIGWLVFAGVLGIFLAMVLATLVWAPTPMVARG
jgi:predicted PurR-regulated permease PerM